jgi:hypothetical protein
MALLVGREIHDDASSRVKPLFSIVRERPTNGNGIVALVGYPRARFWRRGMGNTLSKRVECPVDKGMHDGTAGRQGGLTIY